MPVTDRNVPVFYITASSVSERMLATVAQRVVVPPVEHFINVEVKPDRDQYEPRAEGSFVVTTRTVDGKPIAAEVAVGVSDESVTAIQSEIAGDPRQFFFGADNAYPVQAAASVQVQQYVVLSEEGKAHRRARAGCGEDARRSQFCMREADSGVSAKVESQAGYLGGVAGGDGRGNHGDDASVTAASGRPWRTSEGQVLRPGLGRTTSRSRSAAISARPRSGSRM